MLHVSYIHVSILFFIHRLVQIETNASVNVVLRKILFAPQCIVVNNKIKPYAIITHSVYMIILIKIINGCCFVRATLPNKHFILSIKGLVHF